MALLWRLLPGLAIAFAMTPGSVMAQDAQLNSGDTAWMLTASAIVLMMTVPGLALFYGGMVRKMNVLTIVMQSFATTCVVTLTWMIAGYSLAFNGGNAFIGNLDKAFLANMPVGALSGVIPESVFMMFQMTFAIITPALITGAFADRMKFGAMLAFIALWSLVVYVPIAHMVRAAGGLMFDWGVLDFAGGTVVHISGGVAGLVTALMIGRRRGFGKVPFMPHNLVYSVTGAGLLWVGWFGFNAGSALAASANAGMAMAVTQIAAATAALAWVFAEWMLRGHPSVLGIVSGAVAGLVAITPAAGFVTPGGALVIGLAGGVGCFLGSTTLKNLLGYDDALDAFGVHGIGGAIGALLTGVFATVAIKGGDVAVGWIDGNAGQIVTQIEGIAMTVGYVAVMTAVLFKIVDLTIGMRVSEDIERDGLDLAIHGEAVQ